MSSPQTLPERLRDYAPSPFVSHKCVADVLRDAADRIEALEAALKGVLVDMEDFADEDGEYPPSREGCMAVARDVRALLGSQS